MFSRVHVGIFRCFQSSSIMVRVNMVSVNCKLSKCSCTALKTTLDDKMRIIRMDQPNMGHQMTQSVHTDITAQWTN